MTVHPRRFVLVTLSLFVLALSASGQAGDKADLKWKFEKNKSFFQELTTDTTQDMTVMGTPVKQSQKQTFYFKWTPVEQNDKKEWVIKQQIIGVKMEIQIGGSTIKYDSTNPAGANNPLADFFKALVGTEFTLTLNSEMKVVKLEGRKEFLDKLVAANQQMKGLLEQILSEDALKQMADPTFAAIPNKEVKKDETWTYPSKLNLGPIGSYDTKYEYKYVGKEKDDDKIAVTATLKYEKPGAEAAQGGLPFRIKEAKLDSKSATGTILFDPKLGQIKSSDMKVQLEGSLDIEIGGQSTKVDLKQTQTTTVKLHEKSPIETEKPKEKEKEKEKDKN